MRKSEIMVDTADHSMMARCSTEGHKAFELLPEKIKGLPSSWGISDIASTISSERLDVITARNCPQCQEEEKAIEGRRLALQHREEWLPRAGIPPRFKEASLSNFETGGDQQKEKVLSVLKRYTENLGDNLQAGKSIIFAGPPGTGKTHLACALVRITISNLGTALYTSVLEAARLVKSTYSSQPELRKFSTEREAYKHFLSFDLLVIDEVGIQYQTESEMIILWEIINQRYNNMKATVLVSNETLGAMKEILGSRIMDRMQDNGGIYLPCTWESYRK